MWLDKPAAQKQVVGQYVEVLHPDALMLAVTELASLVGVGRHLKVRAGEHLAAILLTAVYGAPRRFDRGLRWPCCGWPSQSFRKSSVIMGFRRAAGVPETRSTAFAGVGRPPRTTYTQKPARLSNTLVCRTRPADLISWTRRRAACASARWGS